MNRKEQKIFVNNIIKNVKDHLIKDLKKIPDNWDGLELRWFIADHFNLIVFEKKNNKRRREYLNYMLVNGLY